MRGRLTVGKGVLALVLCSALLVGGASDAVASKKRYTLTISFTGVKHQVWSGGHGQDATEHRVTRWVARSRPFLLRRWDLGSRSRFHFDTQVSGELSHVGSTAWADRACLDRLGTTVSGRVQRDGWGPAPIAVWVTPPRRADDVLEQQRCYYSAFDVSSTVTKLTETRAFDLSRRFGRAFTLTHREREHKPRHCGAVCVEETRTYKWELRFLPVGPVETQRWLVEVRGRDKWSWGRTATLGAGVWVDWVHRSTLDVEDGETTATGNVLVEKITPFFTPDGAYVVTHRSSTPRSYKLRRATKNGNRFTLDLHDDPAASYRVVFGVAAGPKLLEAMRAEGLADPERSYDAMVKRGRIDIAQRSPVPNNPRLSFTLPPYAFAKVPDSFAPGLPCGVLGTNEADCFRTRGGEDITVKRVR